MPRVDHCIEVADDEVLSGRKVVRKSSTTTSYITREWNTRRIRVISKTTNGKKARMEFAATEKAKVCTSVRIRYLTVDKTRLGGRGRTGGVGEGVWTVAVGKVGAKFYSSYQRVATQDAPSETPLPAMMRMHGRSAGLASARAKCGLTTSGCAFVDSLSPLKL
jgi:hypothetical protein